MQQRILVIGGEGRLGEPVARQLHAVGHRVRILSRNPERALRAFGSEFEVVGGDVGDRDSIAAALADCDGVHVSLAGGPSPEDFDRVEHRGTATVAQVAAESGTTRLTYLSGAPAVPKNSHDPGSRAKCQAEQAIRDSGVPYTIFKATWMMDALPVFIKGKRAVVVGRQPHPVRWIAATDFAELVARAFQTPEAANKTLFVFGPEALTKPQALDVYVKTVRPDVKLTFVPVRVMKLVAGLAFNRQLRSDVGRMAFYDTVGDDFGDDAEAKALLGQPATTLEEWCRREVSAR